MSMSNRIFFKWFPCRQPQKSGSRFRPRFRVQNRFELTAIYYFRLRRQHQVYVETLSQMEYLNCRRGWDKFDALSAR